MAKAWWQDAVVYQIYPRSFMDSDGDGIGDLRGIIGKLDYLQDLGVDVVWLSPVYRSPNDDNGYDVSDYQDIDPVFGTLADWDELAAGLHARGMKIVMDLVVNHSSDEHPWFVSARASKHSPTRDYYIWRDGKDGREPNNWAATFGGSAWEWNEPTQDYYLHLFSKKQPDLNWENPSLRRAVYDMMSWWIARGVDGFRMDVINALSKVQTFPDAPNPDGRRYVSAPQFYIQGPRLFEFYAEMKREVLAKHDLLSVGEAALTDLADAVAAVDRETGYLNMVITFEHMDIDIAGHGFVGKWRRRPFELERLVAVETKWQEAMADRGWNCLYFNNHDQPRVVSRFGDDGRFRRESATMLATCLHLMQGTPFVYQGEEIGMTNAPFAAIGDFRDIESLNAYRDLVEEQGISAAEALDWIGFRSRDNARTPMQWDATAQAGFTAGTPWIAVNPNHAAVNVAAAAADPDSVLSYYKRLIALRKQHPVVVGGRYDVILDTAPEVWAFTRTDEDEKLLVACNFSREDADFVLPDTVPFEGHETLIGNYPVDPDDSPQRFVLRPYEARVYLRRPPGSRHAQRVLAMTQEAAGARDATVGGDEVEAGPELRREVAVEGT